MLYILYAYDGFYEGQNHLSNTDVKEFATREEAEKEADWMSLRLINEDSIIQEHISRLLHKVPEDRQDEAYFTILDEDIRYEVYEVDMDKVKGWTIDEMQHFATMNDIDIVYDEMAKEDGNN